MAGKNRVTLRAHAEQLLPLLRQEGCYNTGRGPDFLNTTHLLENVLQRAGYSFHPDDSGSLQQTVAFAVPEQKLIVIREDIYDALLDDDPFARYTVVHEFSHIFLQHAVTLHRNAILGDHHWWEDSEWQANNLAAEILMPVEVVRRLGGKPLLIQAACGVSSKAAGYRVDNLKREGVLSD
ncbi:hypothetical protein BAU08_09650 [Bordetella bronchialis]|uniref:IrrE N-terminal-like domain-containing protein n=1 Tax=Bordetella bronchialis TaxID=463025 RepID=A0A193G627_9BORD|nr:hypothetical protein BAU08_09650 [Bordetella bronchialis]